MRADPPSFGFRHPRDRNPGSAVVGAWKAKVAIPVPTIPRDAADLDDALATALVADAFGAMPTGAFFGGRLRNANDATALAPPLGNGIVPLLMRIRYLPTDGVVEAVRRAYGPAVEAPMALWRAYWDRVTGDRLERFACRIGHPGVAGRREPPARPSRETARRLRDGLGRRPDAVDMFLWQAGAVDRFDREPEAHALEDALTCLALEGDRVPFAYVAPVPGARLFPMVVTGAAPRSGTRVLRRPVARAVAEGFRGTPQYWCVPSFLRTCAREMAEALDPAHLAACLLDMARQGHARAFLKHRRQKGGTWVVDLGGVATAGDALAAFARALGPAAFDPALFLGPDAGLFVQEFRRFAYEHRFFVVRGRIVASTPSDRSLTLLDAASGARRLDPRVARLARPAWDEGAFDRGGTTSEANRPLVAAMARRVRALLAATRRDVLSQAVLGHAYAVDVGSVDRDGRDLDLIEVNTFRNAGLYAVDVAKLSRSLVDVASWPRMPTDLDDPAFMPARLLTPAVARRVLDAWLAMRTSGVDDGD